MDRLAAIAASGLRSRMESLEMLANNVANASTGGYKADKEFYSLYVAPEANENETPSTMPLVEKPWVDLSQGTLQVTGAQLDVALSGKGFFTVNGPNGPLYTRDGAFHLAPDGKLVTSDGYAVRGAAGSPFTLSSTSPVDIAPDGSVSQNGSAIDQIAVVDFNSPDAISKQGSNYFRAVDPTATPAPASGTQVEQGRLEASNAGNADSAVRLISVMRQFEMLQKAVGMASEMDRQAVEQVAKVGS
jgi:flagellar basal-body rod protein FlgF